MPELGTRRIDETFGVDSTSEEGARASTDAAARERREPPPAPTAKWPPPRGGVAARAPRATFPDTLALWVARPGGSVDDDVADADQSDDARREAYLCQVGSLEHVPRSGVASHEIASLGLDHRLAFMLSLIDGTSTVAEVLDACGLDELEALALLAQLEEQGLVAFFRPRS